MLSGFTDNATALLIGTNIGGLGTTATSPARLITLRAYARAPQANTGRYPLWFCSINPTLLVPLLGMNAVME